MSQSIVLEGGKYFRRLALRTSGGRITVDELFTRRRGNCFRDHASATWILDGTSLRGTDVGQALRFQKGSFNVLACMGKFLPTLKEALLSGTEGRNLANVASAARTMQGVGLWGARAARVDQLPSWLMLVPGLNAEQPKVLTALKILFPRNYAQFICVQPGKAPTVVIGDAERQKALFDALELGSDGVRFLTHIEASQMARDRELGGHGTLLHDLAGRVFFVKEGDAFRAVRITSHSSFSRPGGRDHFTWSRENARGSSHRFELTRIHDLSDVRPADMTFLVGKNIETKR
ncbi:MAG: hypothetical protein WC901_06460 [Candidatus Margulisiibacteriota bacterium]